MIDNVNRLTGQGIYSEHQLLPYFDECIEEINEELGSNLPLVSKVYEDDFSYIVGENPDDYALNDIRNNYKRIPDAYIRNFICYEVSYRVLRDEDEDQEVYYARAMHAQKWFKRLVATFSDFVLEDSESVLVNGDADEHLGVNSSDDTGVGYYNPYSINNLGE